MSEENSVVKSVQQIRRLTHEGSAASREVAATAEAVAGTAGVLPDAAGVKAHVDSRVTQSGADTTAGRLLKVGDGGLQTHLFASLAGRRGQGASWVKIADLDGVQPSSGDNITMIVSGGGNYGSRARQTYLLQASERGGDLNIQIRNFTTTISAHRHRFYRKQVGNHKFEIWVERPSYDDNFTVIPLHHGTSAGTRAARPIAASTSAPSGLVEVHPSTLYHTGNTTVDGNGFIKAASPIVKLHSDRIEKNGDFSADFERIATGHYVIKNTLGFAQEGWYIETPKDANGNIKVFVEFEDNNGDITVKTYEPDYSTGRVTAGAPADVPEGRWIDLRLHELPPEPETDDSAE